MHIRLHIFVLPISSPRIAYMYPYHQSSNLTVNTNLKPIFNLKCLEKTCIYDDPIFCSIITLQKNKKGTGKLTGHSCSKIPWFVVISTLQDCMLYFPLVGG